MQSQFVQTRSKIKNWTVNKIAFFPLPRLQNCSNYCMLCCWGIATADVDGMLVPVLQ